MPGPSRRLRPLPALLFAAIALAAAAAAQAQGARQTFIVEQGTPSIETFDFDGDGSVDFYAFRAPIKRTDTGGDGVLYGTTLRTGGGPDHDDTSAKQRLGQLVFDLEDDDTIVVMGTTTHGREPVEMDTEVHHVRAVIGGTGTFIGARGQVTTTRAPEGTYTHTFELVN